MKKKKLNFKTIIFIIIILIVLIFLWGRYINTKGLVVKEYAVIKKELPSNFHGLKIVHFSDIHYGQTTNLDDLKKLVIKINSLHPDVVIFTGDLFNHHITPNEKEIKNITKELNKINVSLYKYAINGDNDLNNYNDFQNIMNDSGFILLNNSNELLYYKDNTPIKIVGLTNIENIESAFKTENIDEIFTITLIHKPDEVDYLKEYTTNIALSGHSLGGLVKLPYFEGLIKVNGAKKYISNYYKIDNTTLYVSSGIGTDNIKFRLFNKPSINLYRLYNK